MQRGRFLLRVVLAALLLAGATTPALAAKSRVKAPAPVEKTAPVATPAPAEHAEAGAAEPGLPQLDPTHFPGQAFWLIIAFGLTYVLMRYVALPQVEGTLNKRDKLLDNDLAEAKRHNEEAKKLSAEMDLRMNEARNRAQDQVREAAAQEATKLASALTDQQKKLEEKLRTAEARITEQKKQAIAALDEEAGGMVAAIVKQLANISPSPDQTKKAWSAVKEVQS